MTYYHSTVHTPLRDALKQMLREFDASHIITLAFHEQINTSKATWRIGGWHRQVMKRLFGRSFADRPRNESIEFLLLPEAGAANLHFHGVIHVPETHVAYFERYALPRWRHFAKKGTHDFQPVRKSTEQREEWYSYITKGLLAAEVLHSSMLLEPSTYSAQPRTVSCRSVRSEMIKPVIAEALHEPVLTSAKRTIDNP